MATSHKLVKTNQVGYVLVDELSRDTNDAKDILEATKQASECVPDLILPEPDLKTMRQVFEDEVEKTPVKDAFEPYRDRAIGNGYDERDHAVYVANWSSINFSAGLVILEGIENTGEVTADGMNNSQLVFLNDELYASEGLFELGYDERTNSEFNSNFKVFRKGIYSFSGEFNLLVGSRILPDLVQEGKDPGFPTFIRSGDDEIKYRITLQQIVGGSGPYDEIPFTIVDNFIVGEGSFNKVDIAKRITKRLAFNFIVRVNSQDKFALVLERSRIIANYDDGAFEDAVIVSKIGLGSSDPYVQEPDASNFIRCICLVNEEV